ncbi:ROK family protein [Egicoccus halophilus]|uniref:Glucokinase n=1 Tax=Egicoccus halophilus TaxID=1670830 RepID=A0A8J3ESF3_9ACTN|nr:ROK family protein [Egicoccus halophilus]GGI07273.1 glucokinase [Egicoccus halophilus]
MSDPVAIGIDIGGTKLVAATVAADGRVLDRQRRETPAHDSALLLDTLRTSIRQLSGDRTDLPVGIGIAGLVSPDGVIRYGPNIGVRDVAIAEELGEVTSGPVAVVNDASAATLGEQRAGAARGHRDVVMFTLGTGVGGGVVVDGKLLLGAHGFATEIGHVIVEEGGRRCPCGNRGCIEAYASGSSIGRIAAERLVASDGDSPLRVIEAPTGRDVSQAALGGDALAVQVLVEAGTWLGVAAASLVNLLDPEVVLLGGGAALATSRWIVPAASEALEARMIGREWRTPPPIELAALGDDAGMVGAAQLAADRAGEVTGPSSLA